jgi:hypothetical protein
MVAQVYVTYPGAYWHGYVLDAKTIFHIDPITSSSRFPVIYSPMARSKL